MSSIFIQRSYLSTTKLHHESSFSLDVNEDEKTKRVSNRQKFRDITPDYTTLHKLDDSRLGYASRRKQRVAIAKRFGNIRNHPPQFEKKNLGDVLKDQRKESPYPFKKRGVPLFVATTYDDVPDAFPGNTPPPEIALIGRSNVGKSTLLNALLAYDESYMQKSPVSDKPGETRHLHFYGLGRHPLKSPPVVTPQQLVSDKKKSKSEANDEKNLTKLLGKKLQVDKEGSALVLVDMPGYGFSFMNATEKHRIQTMSSTYIRERGPALKRLVLLLDARHGFKLGDRQFFQHLIEGTFPDPREEEELARAAAAAGYASLEEALEADSEKFSSSRSNSSRPKARRLDRSNIHWKLQIVVTKCDLVDRLELARRIQIISDTASEMLPGFGTPLPIIAVSGKFGNGIVELKKELGSLVPCPPQWSTSNEARRREQSLTNPSSTAEEESQLTRRKGRVEICKKTGVRRYISNKSKEQVNTVLSREQKKKKRAEERIAKAARREVQMKHQREQERKKARQSNPSAEPELKKKPRWRDIGKTHASPRTGRNSALAVAARARSAQSNRIDNYGVDSDFPSPLNRRARRAERYSSDRDSDIDRESDSGRGAGMRDRKAGRGPGRARSGRAQSTRESIRDDDGDYDDFQPGPSSGSSADSNAGNSAGRSKARRGMPRSAPTRRKRVGI